MYALTTYYVIWIIICDTMQPFKTPYLEYQMKMLLHEICICNVISKHILNRKRWQFISTQHTHVQHTILYKSSFTIVTNYYSQFFILNSLFLRKYFHSQFAILRQALFILNLQLLLIENGELRMENFHSQFAILKEAFFILNLQWWLVENGELRMANWESRFFHSQFSIIKKAFFIFYLQWWLVDNGESRMAIFLFSIRHSQVSIIHSQFTMIVSWEWWIENSNFFHSQFAILKQAFFILNLQWWLVDNGELRMAIFPSSIRYSQVIILHILFTMMISWE
jgi:hypothetical protein